MRRTLTFLVLLTALLRQPAPASALTDPRGEPALPPPPPSSPVPEPEPEPPKDPSIAAQATTPGVRQVSVGVEGCTWELVDGLGAPYVQAAYPRTDTRGVVWHLYIRTCDGVSRYAEVPERTGRDLLLEARHDLQTRLLPKPATFFQPLNAEHDWTYVKLPVDIRVPAAQWRAVSVTATAGPVWVTVTATPRRLTFDSGDTHRDAPPPVSCDGASATALYEPKVPGACSYTYQHASSTSAYDGYHFLTTTSVVWDVAYVGSDGAGTAPELATEAKVPLAVAEVQAILCVPGSTGCDG